MTSDTAKQLRVAIVAPPGAGKTTLANQVTGALKARGIRWCNVNEFARAFIDKNGNEQLLDMGVWGPYVLGTKQLRREQNVAADAAGFITDSPLFLPWFYAQGAKGSKLCCYTVLTELYKMFVHSLTDYDLVLYLAPGKEYDKSSTRAQTKKEAEELGLKLWMALTDHGVAMHTITGTPAARLDSALKLIEERL